MWLSLFSLLLILAITFYQGLQGLFSAVISCILTVLAAALAFGLYEDAYYAFLSDASRLPDQGRAIALVTIFVVAGVALRFLYDSLFTGNMQFPVYVDRAGGGLFGLITALVVVGMMTTGLQMLPFGQAVLGFERFTMMDKGGGGVVPDEEAPELDYWSKVKPARNTTWLNADGFTVALVSHLSDNALRGRADASLPEVYPNFLDTSYRAQNRLHKEWQVASGAPGSLRVIGYWDAEKPGDFWVRTAKKGKEANEKMIQLKPAPAEEGGLKRLAVRVELDGKARDKGGFCFRSDQVRLVGREGKTGVNKDYLLAGVNLLTKDPQPQAVGKLIEVYPSEPFQYQPEESKFDFVFRVPSRPDFEPLFVEYKLNSRGAFAGADDLNAKPHPPLGPKPKGGKPQARPIGAPPVPKDLNPTPEPAPTPAPQSDSGSSTPPANAKADDGMQRAGEEHGRTHGIGPARKESGYTDQLPFDELTSYSGLDASNGIIRGGHMVAHLGDDWSPPKGTEAPLTKFEVPAGMKMLQLSVEKLQPGSWLGGVLGNARDNIADIYLVDASGKNYMPVGRYAMATVGGRKVFELNYLDETQRGMAKIPKFEQLKGIDLQGDYVYYFLFHVPPGTKPVHLNTGGRAVDLRQMNLEAPR
jgi:hypothetical protein